MLESIYNVFWLGKFFMVKFIEHLGSTLYVLSVKNLITDYWCADFEIVVMIFEAYCRIIIIIIIYDSFHFVVVWFHSSAVPLSECCIVLFMLLYGYLVENSFELLCLFSILDRMDKTLSLDKDILILKVLTFLFHCCFMFSSVHAFYTLRPNILILGGYSVFVWMILFDFFSCFFGDFFLIFRNLWWVIYSVVGWAWFILDWGFIFNWVVWNMFWFFMVCFGVTCWVWIHDIWFHCLY